MNEENLKIGMYTEKKYEKVGTLTGELLYEENTKLINQQKEFIEWLEKMIKDLFRNEEYGVGATYDYILSKYKEIIGVKDEN